MTTHDEHDNDGSLKPYLEGRDGVSATYRKVAGEQPPAELDALILQAAAGAVARPAPQRGATRRQYYAMAASLCLGVLLTSLYYEQQVAPEAGPLIVTARVDQNQVGELDLARPAVADGGTAEALVSVGQVQAEAVQRNAARAQAEEAAVAPNDTAASESFQAPATPAPAVIALQGLQAEAQLTGAAGIVEEARQAGLQPPPATRARTSTPELADALQDNVAGAGTELQEQAARVRMEIPAENSPRIVEELSSTASAANTSVQVQAQALWLEEIMRLASELQSLTDQSETLRQRLEAERASFSAAYPDFDLDAALAQ